jgi:hypothetical protein
MWYDRVEFQAETAKKPGDERSGCGELLLGQREPSIILAKLARRPGYVLYANGLAIPPAVVPGPIAELHELYNLARATHDEVRRRLCPGLLKARDAAVGARLSVGDVNHDEADRLAPTAAVVRRWCPESAGVLRGHV